jgi:uncharacterized membrane protein
MDGFLSEFGFGVGDLEALLVFLAVWGGYTLVADHSPLQKHSIAFAMDRHRHRWLAEASSRELRMIDTGVLRILVTGISFFASSTIFVIGGLIAAMGYSKELAEAFTHIPFANILTVDGWALRLGLLLAIFIYAFFKFAWAFRIANYCAIVIGSMSDVRYDENDRARLERAQTAADLSALSGHHFNRGIRAYFFALACLGWFIGPLFFALTTLGVLTILIRREFASRPAKLVRDLD